MHANNLKGKVAIITGASRGIGKSIAITLSRQGINIALAARSADKLNQVKKEIEDSGGKALCIPTDIADEKQIQELVRQTISHFGRLDIVINNAAIGIFKPLAETSLEEWKMVMSVNSTGPFILCREAIPYLKKQQISYIVNISSVVGVKGYENQSAYTASKHALMGMSKSLAKEVRDMGIRVHAICPGGVDTELVSNARPDLDTSVLMKPQEIADTVLFLLSMKGNAVIDEIHLHRRSSTPWA